jgi:hypothetical protein
MVVDKGPDISVPDCYGRHMADVMWFLGSRILFAGRGCEG